MLATYKSPMGFVTRGIFESPEDSQASQPHGMRRYELERGGRTAYPRPAVYPISQLMMLARSLKPLPPNTPSLSYLSTRYKRQAELSNTLIRSPQGEVPLSTIAISSRAGTILYGFTVWNHVSVLVELIMWIECGIESASRRMSGFTVLAVEVGEAVRFNEFQTN